MQEIYKSMGAVVGFSVLTLIIQNFISDKAAQNFVLLVLLSMLIINSGKVVKFAEKVGGKSDGDNQ